MSHLESLPVPYGKSSIARWATAPDGTVVVFVHGFGGDVSTWDEFDELLPLEPKAKGTDLVFFTYDGLSTPALTSSAQLRTMLDDLMTQPARFVNGTLDPADHRPAFAYDKLIVVAHSLGAVVARKALLDAFRAGAKWLPKVSLALFAPAHRGAPILELAKEVLGALHVAAMPVAKILTSYTVLNDLEPDCRFLADLRSDTEKALQKGAATLAARHVATAAKDAVVAHLDFVFEDAPVSPIPASHTSVCKPRDDFRTPIDIVAGLL